MALKTNS